MRMDYSLSTCSGNELTRFLFKVDASRISQISVPFLHCLLFFSFFLFFCTQSIQIKWARSLQVAYIIYISMFACCE